MKKYILLLIQSWKKFYRNDFFLGNIFIKIFASIGTSFIFIMCLFVGIFIDRILIELGYSGDIVDVIHKIVFSYFLFSLFYNFILAPEVSFFIKPYILLPIKKNNIYHYFIFQLLSTSIINYVPFFLFIPIGIVLILPKYSLIYLVFWFLNILFISMSLSIFSIYIRKEYHHNLKKFSMIFLIFIMLIGIEYMGIVNFGQIFLIYMKNIIENPIWIFLSFAILFIFYHFFLQYLKKQFYLTTKTKESIKTSNNINFSETNLFKNLIMLDLKLIYRNKKILKFIVTTPILLFIYLPYSSKISQDNNFKSTYIFFLIIFLLIKVSSIYIQYIFEFKSNFIDFILTKFGTKKYFSTILKINALFQVLVFSASSLYVYFFLTKMWAYIIISLGIFSIGIYFLWIIYVSIIIPVKINFNDHSVFSGDILKNILLFLPIILFMTFIYFIDMEILTIILLFLGVNGLIFRRFILILLENYYKQNKYKMATIYRRNI